MSTSMSSPSEIPPPKAKINPAHHLLSGAVSGLASAVCLQPLDLIKTRLQQGPVIASPVVLLDGTGVLVKGVGKSREIGPVVREVISSEGIRGLWRGTVPTIARNVPGVAAYFYFLTDVRTRLALSGYFAASLPQTSPIPSLGTTSSKDSKSTTLPKLNLQGNLLAGALARTTVGFVLNPFTVLKSRYESNLYSNYTSLTSAFIQLFKTDGVRGLFQGFTATAIRDAPYAGMSVVIYEESKEILGRVISPAWGVPYSAIHALSGMSAAGLATLATSPADCIKTRMQLQPKANPTMRAAMSSIYSDRGLKGFLAGSSLRISRKAASSAIAWSIYEGMLLFIRDRAL